MMVTGLPPSGSWQDLKDHMRDAGDVCYSDVFKDGSGVVEYMRREDMKYALKKLDDSRFKSHEVIFIVIVTLLEILHFVSILTRQPESTIKVQSNTEGHPLM